MDFLVSSEKDDKPEVPSYNSLNVDNSVGRKGTHALFEKGRVISVLWPMEGLEGLVRTLKSSCTLSFWATVNPAH